VSTRCACPRRRARAGKSIVASVLRSALAGHKICSTYSFYIKRAFDVEIRRPWRIPQAAARRSRSNDVRRDRKGHWREAARFGAYASAVVEQQRKKQRDDADLARCGL